MLSIAALAKFRIYAKSIGCALRGGRRFSSQCVSVWPSDWGVVSLHRSHYLKSSALKQKVRDQQILTSGQAYDSILMQFSNSNSLIITLLCANLILHPSKFRHIHSASIFAEVWQWQHSSHLFQSTSQLEHLFSLLLHARHLKNWAIKLPCFMSNIVTVDIFTPKHWESKG